MPLLKLVMTIKLSLDCRLLSLACGVHMQVTIVKLAGLTSVETTDLAIGFMNTSKTCATCMCAAHHERCRYLNIK
jgi:hypothetical protein